jgi:hypothetical protein
MNVKHLTPFVDALVKVLNDHGIDNLKRGKLLKKDVMNVDLDVTSVVGIGGGIRGNIAYSLSSETCRHLFVGMLTDSRSFLSYTRHEYFRRILCNLIGRWAEDGEVPMDIEILGAMVQEICYYNAKNYFGF